MSFSCELFWIGFIIKKSISGVGRGVTKDIHMIMFTTMVVPKLTLRDRTRVVEVELLCILLFEVSHQYLQRLVFPIAGFGILLCMSHGWQRKDFRLGRG